ncbi:hypothetical protein [Streptomyces xinghaiensis]|uniref:hypothetical protein n=1 Tax=Streptomyces xinghaiensis TaxID=1038928 RepID=UPI0002E5F229|nr:hypothetical protein [Streptomyces xinghaiensis]MZE80913.1 hypothetical protein [Streptomyces sp. SID5475]
MPSEPRDPVPAEVMRVIEKLTTDPAWPDALRSRLDDGTPEALVHSNVSRQKDVVADLVAGPPGELLNASKAARCLGYKNANQVTTYLRDHPGYFPEPDSVEVLGTPENPRRRLGWLRVTLLTWVLTRPGKGRRKGSGRGTSALPQVPSEGDPGELLGASQAAALLGFTSVNSFSSSLAQGRLPLLCEPDATEPNPRGGPPRRKWTRRRLLEQAAARRRS